MVPIFSLDRRVRREEAIRSLHPPLVPFYGGDVPLLLNLDPLPIDVHLPAIVSTLQAHSGLVITAAPGAGKTTRIPRAIYDSRLAARGEILIVQPRRIAARLAAARVAAELGEELGRTVGFAVRFESVGGAETRIRFATEGVLSRRIIRDPLLRGVSAVLLDEFHERHVATDLCLALLRRLQKRERPDLKLVVLSATMEPAPVASFLGDVPIITCEEARFSLDVQFEEKPDGRPLHEKVAFAVRRLLREGLNGDVLVFLPGAAEIRMATDALKAGAARTDLAVLPLHGELSMARQAAAIEPNPRRKIILATNVAETSVTIPGVVAVVDSGLARVAIHSPWTGIPGLKLARISKASAAQRAGRAGRTRPGRVCRLYTRQDFESRQERDTPEIRRADLAETVLTLHGAGLSDPRSLTWFEPPQAAALEAAEKLLRTLSALDEQGSLTATGHSMLRFPLHPRLARLIIETENLHVGKDGARLAALLSERDIRLESGVLTAPTERKPRVGQLSSSDALDLLDRLEEAREVDFNSGRLHSLGLEPNAVERVRRACRQLERLVPGSQRLPAEPERQAESLRIALLASFPDRVAKRRARGSRTLLLSTGGEARLSESSSVHEAPLLVALDVEERHGGGTHKGESGPIVRLASAVEPEWLAALFPDRLSQEVELRWNEDSGRVDEVKRTRYDQVVLEEITRPAVPSATATDLLVDAVVSRGLSCFKDGTVLAGLQVRLAMLAKHFPDEQSAVLDEISVNAMIRRMCDRKCSLAEVAAGSLIGHCLARLTEHQRDLLQRQFPERFPLGRKRSVRIHYEEDQPPWIESRLQDFFGVKTSPAICGGRVRLTVRLLAPNGRPVQITQDLEGFWKRHYPAVRRELQRRYPKHAWPEPGDIYT